MSFWLQIRKSAIYLLQIGLQAKKFGHSIVQYDYLLVSPNSKLKNKNEKDSAFKILMIYHFN
jgi:hypothetical protein